MGFPTEGVTSSGSDRTGSAWERTDYESSSWAREDDRSSARRQGQQFSAEECADLFGLELYRDGLDVTVQRLVDSHGAGQVRQWADEGMRVETMGKPRSMEAFRERQAERPEEVPRDVERQNAASVQRSRDAHHESSKAGDAGVPDSVRDVVSSPGQRLDSGIQGAIEERMGDTLGDVRIHTGPKAAKACQDINARAFTVGNHVAFNTGEYDPESPEGQHVLAHELAHVRQQTGGAVSMLPQSGALEVDPDERLEREAERTAERVMDGGTLGVYRLADADVHVQRLPAEMVLPALEMFKTENESGGVGSFQQAQNQDRIEFIEEQVQWAIDNVETHAEALDRQDELIVDARMRGNEERASRLDDVKDTIESRIGDLFAHIQDKADQIALTDDQREKLYGDNEFDGGEALAELGWTTVKSLISLVPGMGPIIAAHEIGETALRQFWEQTDGALTERLLQIKEQMLSEADHGGDSQGDELGK